MAFALAERQVLLAIEVAPGTTAREAVALSGIRARFPEVDPFPEDLGIFGTRVAPDTVLEEGDRVEIYRALQMDPREARRRRAASQER